MMFARSLTSHLLSRSTSCFIPRFQGGAAISVPRAASSQWFSTSAAATTDSDTESEVDDAPSASAIASLQEKFQSNPASASVSFASTSKLTNGLRSQATIRDKFKIHADEPAMLGGTDTAPNPVEIVLAALGTCQEITYKAYSQASGIPMDSVSVQVTGDVDLRGFFAVSDDVRPGFQKIYGTVTIQSPAPTEQIEQLKQMVDAHCPVLDIIKSVPTEITLVHEKV